MKDLRWWYRSRSCWAVVAGALFIWRGRITVKYTMQKTIANTISTSRVMMPMNMGLLVFHKMSSLSHSDTLVLGAERLIKYKQSQSKFQVEINILSYISSIFIDNNFPCVPKFLKKAQFQFLGTNFNIDINISCKIKVMEPPSQRQGEDSPFSDDQFYQHRSGRKIPKLETISYPYKYIFKKQLLHTQQYKGKDHQGHDERIYFKYQVPYPLQLNYMNHVLYCLDNNKIGCLVEAPTGSGKTLCLLNSVFGWLCNMEKETLKKYKRKVIYMSRCHAQLEQIEKELKSTCYRPKMVIFGGRTKTCTKFINEQEINVQSKCEKAVKLKKQWDKYLKQWTPEQQMEKMENKLFQSEAQYLEELQNIKSKQKRKQLVRAGMCNLYQDYYQRSIKNKIVFNQLQKQPVTINDQIRQCMKGRPISDLQETDQTCPYYYPSTTKYNADLILMPYNYILDKRILERNKVIVENSILIFDEAHNIVDTARNGMSVTLKPSDFKKSRDILNIWVNKKEKKLIKSNHYQLLFDAESQDEANPNELALNVISRWHQGETQANGPNKLIQTIKLAKECSDNLKFLETNMTKYFSQRQIPKYMSYNEYGESSQSIPRINNKDPINLSKCLLQMLFQKVVPNQYWNSNYEATVSEYSQKLMNVVRELRKIFESIKAIDDFYHFGLAKLADLLKMPADLMKSKEMLYDYGVFFKWKKFGTTINVQEVQMYCYNAKIMFKKVLGYNPKCLIITSGTMSPNRWQEETGIQFLQAPAIAENHVVKQHQTQTILVTNAKYNVGDKDENGKYPQMDYAVKKSMEVIERVCLNTKQNAGIMVIVASKRWINQYSPMRKQYNNIKNIVKRKPIYEDSENVKDLIKFQEDYRRDCQSQTGCILFAVNKGKLTEGIDFKGDLCRAVIVVGFPYPKIDDPYFIEKKSYIQRIYNDSNKTTVSKSNWVNIEVIRAVNQGIGRVIRDNQDYGIIFLLGETFYWRGVRELIAGWAQRRLSKEADITNIGAICKKFFEVNQQTNN